MPKVFHAEGERARNRERMFIIDGLLRKGGYPSAQKLAKHCGVSVKTILRDIEYLKAFMSAPFAYNESEKGWYYTDKAFSLPAQFVGRDDMQALLVLGEIVSQYEGTPIAKRMQATYERLAGLFKAEDLEKYQSLAKRICFAPAATRPVKPEIWENILQALMDDQRLELEYQKSGTGPVAKRRFDAFGLIVRDRDWYLYGYCHLRKCRLTLALPFIRKAELVDDYFDLPKEFDLKQYAKSGFQGLQSDGQPEHEVILRFAPDVAVLAASKPMSAEQKEKTESSGHLRVSFLTTAIFRVEREVLAWGDKVEVLAPKELREKVAEVVRGMGRIYK